MTYEQREKIFSKEALTNEDLMALYDISCASASLLQQKIKAIAGDRLGIKGRVHIEDYKKFFEISDTNLRYCCEIEESAPPSSVCLPRRYSR